MVSEKKKASNARYDAKTTKHYGFKLNRNTDAELIKRLEEQPNVQAYIKRLIAQDIGK